MEVNQQNITTPRLSTEEQDEVNRGMAYVDITTKQI